MRPGLFHLALAAVLLCAGPAHAAEPASPNDSARVLAGLAPPTGSPLQPLTANKGWQQHAQTFNEAFGRVEQRQLSKIRPWSAANLPATRPTLIYFFSGPDFLYANALFPNAKTYVLAGLEPVGAVPDLTRLPGGLGSVLPNLQTSLRTILNISFFITAEMNTQLNSGPVNGTLPILYVFLARTGHMVEAAEPVRIDAAGALGPDIGPAPVNASRGIKITFKKGDGDPKTLYYFTTNLADDGVRKSGFLKFCQSLGPADAFIKSASYLLHSSGFSQVRSFLLANSTAIVQDDSGIPLSFFDGKSWDMKPFGRYVGPIQIFAGNYQSAYATLFKKSPPIEFGLGYRWRPNESNVLVATRKAAPPAADGNPPKAN